MLINFSIENWISCRYKATLSMVTTEDTLYGKGIPKPAEHKIIILPTAAIFGGNASGKTNLFRALNFAKFMVNGFMPIDNIMTIDQFKLDTGKKTKLSKFVFELLINEKIFEFSFVLTSTEV
ncbi:MAG: ATP-binding protein [Deltaproteobacteria bacterium]|jgi:AAA15 family ATPase/GTPase|nr:ATP-binding protein [Deltaproteobacteria bacterium]